MTVEIRLPQYGMGMQEGAVSQWFKAVGDTVQEGEVLAEVEAAKTTEDLVAPTAGVLERIVVPEGEIVPVHELLAVLTTDDGAKVRPAPVAGQQPGATDEPTARRASAGGSSAGLRDNRQVTPRARRLAGDLGVDLDRVTGTGPGGRVVEADVEAAAAASGEASAGTEDAETVPVTPMRAAIAASMHESLRSTAQFTLVRTVDVTDLVSHRDSLAEPRPTYTDMVVKAAALALRRHPRLNSVLDGKVIRLLPDVHIGVATALDEGLTVPVVRDADRRSLAEIAALTAELVGRARAGTLKSDDLSGATFTVTSLGGQGIDAFTPIINPPQVAILGVGRIVEHPVPADGGSTGVEWRKAMTLSLTIDHRVVDGAPGAAFLVTMAELLASGATIGT